MENWKEGREEWRGKGREAGLGAFQPIKMYDYATVVCLASAVVVGA